MSAHDCELDLFAFDQTRREARAHDFSDPHTFGFAKFDRHVFRDSIQKIFHSLRQFAVTLYAGRFIDGSLDLRALGSVFLIRLFNFFVEPTFFLLKRIAERALFLWVNSRTHPLPSISGHRLDVCYGTAFTVSGYDFRFSCVLGVAFNLLNIVVRIEAIVVRSAHCSRTISLTCRVFFRREHRHTCYIVFVLGCFLSAIKRQLAAEQLSKRIRLTGHDRHNFEASVALNFAQVGERLQRTAVARIVHKIITSTDQSAQHGFQTKAVFLLRRILRAVKSPIDLGVEHHACARKRHHARLAKTARRAHGARKVQQCFLVSAVRHGCFSRRAL